MTTRSNVRPDTDTEPLGAEVNVVPATRTEPLVVMPSDCVVVPGAAGSIAVFAVVNLPTSSSALSGGLAQVPPAVIDVW